jgi:hypothetical protein
LIPEFTVNDGFLLAYMPSISIKNLSDIHPVPEELIQCVAIKGFPAVPIAISADVQLGSISQRIELRKERGDRISG